MIHTPCLCSLICQLTSRSQRKALFKFSNITLFKIITGHLRQQYSWIYTRIVHQNINTAHFPCCGTDHILCFLFSAHSTGDKGSLMPITPELLTGFALEGLLMD